MRAVFGGAILGIRVEFEVSPLPSPLRYRSGRGFRKNGLQNLEHVGVRGQNLDSKRVARFGSSLTDTASALTMISLSIFRVKVRCHTVPVDFRAR